MGTMPETTDRSDREIQTYEQQAGETGSSEFSDALTHSAKWRPPNVEEWRAIEDYYRNELDGKAKPHYVAILEGYFDEQPGYRGKLAILIFGFPETTQAVRVEPGPEGPEVRI